MKTKALLVVIALGTAAVGVGGRGQSSSAPPDLNGTWTTADGTMVAVTHRGAAIEARCLVPNRQMAAVFGWTSGEIVFRGTIAAGTITGQIAYRYPIKGTEACPDKARIMLDMEMQVLGAGQLLGRAQQQILGRDCRLVPGSWGAIEFTRKSFDVQESPAAIDVEIRDGILFDHDRAELKPDARGVLRELKQLVLDPQPFVRVQIQGHTDSQGTDAYNLTLSLQRANAVARWLIENGVPADRLEAKGLGRTRPLVPNSTAANRARNRRVEIKVIKSSLPTRPLTGVLR